MSSIESLSWSTWPELSGGTSLDQDRRLYKCRLVISIVNPTHLDTFPAWPCASEPRMFLSRFCTSRPGLTRDIVQIDRSRGLSSFRGDQRLGTIIGTFNTRNLLALLQELSQCPRPLNKLPWCWYDKRLWHDFGTRQFKERVGKLVLTLRTWDNVTLFSFSRGSASGPTLKLEVWVELLAFFLWCRIPFNRWTKRLASTRCSPWR